MCLPRACCTIRRRRPVRSLSRPWRTRLRRTTIQSILPDPCSSRSPAAAPTCGRYREPGSRAGWRKSGRRSRGTGRTLGKSYSSSCQYVTPSCRGIKSIRHGARRETPSPAGESTPSPSRGSPRPSAPPRPSGPPGPPGPYSEISSRIPNFEALAPPGADPPACTPRSLAQAPAHHSPFAICHSPFSRPSVPVRVRPRPSPAPRPPGAEFLYPEFFIRNSPPARPRSAIAFPLPNL